MFIECSHEHSVNVVRTFTEHSRKRFPDVRQTLDFLMCKYPPNILRTFIEHSRKYFLDVH